MIDENKTKEQLINELVELRQIISKLEASEIDYRFGEKVLKQNEAFYQTILEDLPDLICRWLPDGTITYVNDNYCLYFNKRTEELIGQSFVPLIAEEDREKLQKHVSAFSIEKPVAINVERVMLPEGVTRWQQWTNRAIFDKDGNLHEFQSIGQDITERKQAEEQLQRYKLFSDEAVQGFGIATLEGKISYMNPTFCHLLGVECLENAVGKTFSEYYSEEAQETIEKYVIPALMHEEQWSGELALRTKDGRLIPTLNNAFLIKDNNGAPLYLADIITDITERKKIEKTLKDSEKNFRVLVENSPDVIMRLDREGDILFINYTLPELTVEGVLGTKVFNYLSTEDGLKYKKALQELFSSGESKSFEVSAAGATYWFIRLIPISTHKEVESALVIATDITRRTLSEKVLRDSEEKLSTIMETVPTGIVISTLEGEIMEANATASKISGFESKEEFLKQHVPLRYNNPSDRKRFVDLLNKDGQVEEFEVEVKRKDNTIFWVSINSIKRMAPDGITLFISAFQDITKRKKDEEALQESHQLMEKTFASLHDAVFIIDADTIKITNCNPAASDIFGYSRQEMIGRTTTFLHVDETTLDKFRRLLYSNVEEKGFLSQFEFSMRRKDGTVFPSEHNVTPLDDARGKRIGWVSVVRDITERKKAEKEMLKSQKLESLGILAGGIAHDFNNLLTAIVGNISMAERFSDSGSKDNLHKSLKEAVNASMRAKSLSQQLLTFASGGLPVKKVISIGGFIKQTAGFALKGSKVRCEYSISDDLAPVEADEGQIGQVVQNLLINACQAMPEGGVINVHAENINIDSKETLPLKLGRYVKISITDHGAGISKKHISKIFDPYFTTKQTGSGLGLATTYSIIGNHGGHIVVKSKIGVGTTFCIYLPATDKKVDLEIDTGDVPFLGHGRILIMDDEEIIRNFLCDALRHFGYEVDSAINGAEAINLYKKADESGQPYNAVILDLTVPGGIGGKETVKELLKIDPGANVIVSSGYSNNPIMAEYDKYGFKGVVAKPYNLKELSEVVYKVIKGISA